jgi:DNA adenine methylase
MGIALFKYHGAKWRIAPWIVRLMPPHRCYVEPFGGSAAVLMHKPRALTEIYNDLNDEVVNVFRVIRDNPEAISSLLELTPYSRTEMDNAYEPTDDPIESCRRFLVRSNQAISTTSLNEKTGFRAHINSKDYASQPSTWSKLPQTIWRVKARLNKTIIENVDAFLLFERYDLPETLWFLDPPYPMKTRTSASVRRGYNCDLSDAQHILLLERIITLKGKVILASYKNELYDEYLQGWKTVHKVGFTDSQNRSKSIETLYLNYDPPHLLFADQ